MRIKTMCGQDIIKMHLCATQWWKNLDISRNELKPVEWMGKKDTILSLLYRKIIPASLFPIYEMWCRVDSTMKFYDANTFSSQAEAPNTPQEFVGGSRLWGMWAQTTISSASCLISTLGNSANTDLIRQAKVCSYPQNKQTNIFLL